MKLTKEELEKLVSLFNQIRDGSVMVDAIGKDSEKNLLDDDMKKSVVYQLNTSLQILKVFIGLHLGDDNTQTTTREVDKH